MRFRRSLRAESIMLLFGYVGPETTLPIASALATVVGFVLMTWRFALGFVKKYVRFGTKRS